jgi:hypothetical protein
MRSDLASKFTRNEATMRLDLRRRRRRRRLSALGLAFAVSLAVAVPATGKAPAFPQHACIKHADTTTAEPPSRLTGCDEGETAVSTGGHIDEVDAAMVAGGMSFLFVAVATGWLVSIRGKEAPVRRPGHVAVFSSEP